MDQESKYILRKIVLDVLCLFIGMETVISVFVYHSYFCMRKRMIDSMMLVSNSQCIDIVLWEIAEITSCRKPFFIKQDTAC
jgi:hypothetical protein